MELKKSIKIARSDTNWRDLTNNLLIGLNDDLLNYVNKCRLFVKNQEVFKHSNKFWYNLEVK